MHRVICLGALALAAATAGCYDAPVSETRVVVNSTAYASSGSSSGGGRPVAYVVDHDHDHDDDHDHDHHHHDDDGRYALAEARLAPGEADRVVVLQSSHLNRPAEVLGIVDVHLDVANQGAALAALRRRAAAMGANAVVGVEYHHGEVESGPIHLSGLAVRFVDMTPYPHD